MQLQLQLAFRKGKLQIGCTPRIHPVVPGFRIVSKDCLASCARDRKGCRLDWILCPSVRDSRGHLVAKGSNTSSDARRPGNPETTGRRQVQVSTGWAVSRIVQLLALYQQGAVDRWSSVSRCLPPSDWFL
jgi:hypothetical protein